MPDRNFGTDIGDTVDTRYEDEVKPMNGENARGGCMAAVYNGALAALYGETYARQLWKDVYRTARRRERRKGKSEGFYNTVDLIMELLQDAGRAGDPWVFRHTKGAWSCEEPKDYAGKGVEEAIKLSLVAAKDGWFFFGASVSGGYHSVILGVKVKDGARTIYWLDQFSKGLDGRRSGYATGRTEVTGTLDTTLAAVGKARTRLWPLYVASA
jgi:hypothetical protein